MKREEMRKEEICRVIKRGERALSVRQGWAHLELTVGVSFPLWTTDFSSEKWMSGPSS
jgi:hypothetical protein